MIMTANPYEQNLNRNAANFQALTSLSLLERSAGICPHRVAILHGTVRRNYRDF